MQSESNLKLYIPVFAEGLHGTLLAYLISQHEGFYTFSKYETINNAVYKNHLLLEDFFYLSNRNSICNHLHFYEVLDFHINIMSKKADKFIFKLLEHQYSIPITHKEGLMKYDINILLLYTNHSDIFDERTRYCKDNPQYHMFNESALKNFNDTVSEISKLYNCIAIDSYEILYFKNEKEYTKMCEWLEVEPIDDWKYICDAALNDLRAFKTREVNNNE